MLLLFPHHSEEFDVSAAMQEPWLQLAIPLWLYNVLVNSKLLLPNSHALRHNPVCFVVVPHRAPGAISTVLLLLLPLSKPGHWLGLS